VRSDRQSVGDSIFWIGATGGEPLYRGYGAMGAGAPAPTTSPLQRNFHCSRVRVVISGVEAQLAHGTPRSLKHHRFRPLMSSLGVKRLHRKSTQSNRVLKISACPVTRSNYFQRGMYNKVGEVSIPVSFPLPLTNAMRVTNVSFQHAVL
jgi:hypothetical protein